MPLLTPRLSSLWIGLVTPVDAGVARPLVEGLSTQTVVTDDAARGCSRRRADAGSRRIASGADEDRWACVGA